MRNFIRLAIIFFVMFFSLGAEQFSSAQPVDITGSIQNIKNETVVLVSNNILGGEILSSQEEGFDDFLSSSTLAINNDLNKNLFVNNYFIINGRFIHNLSTNNQKVHQIRAP